MEKGLAIAIVGLVGLRAEATMADEATETLDPATITLAVIGAGAAITEGEIPLGRGAAEARAEGWVKQEASSRWVHPEDALRGRKLRVDPRIEPTHGGQTLLVAHGDRLGAGVDLGSLVIHRPQLNLLEHTLTQLHVAAAPHQT